MHIMEGFLSGYWCLLWFALSIPFVVYGIRKLEHIFQEKPELKPLIAVAAAFVFILSAIKIPSVAGSSSHATGTGFAAILFGPAVTAVISVIVLLYQAIFLAHGGLTTLGANVFSMGIVGPCVTYALYKIFMHAKIKISSAIFIATVVGNLFTYITTSLQLALAFPAPVGGIIVSLGTFVGIFGITQIPIAVVEGMLTVTIFKYIQNTRADILAGLNIKSIKNVEKMNGREAA